MMLTALAAAVLTLLGAAQVVAMLVLRRFALRHRARPEELTDPAMLPKAAMVLALRGADPHLTTGLRRLLAQRYPDHELVVVVDHREDPAWSCVEQVIDEQGDSRLKLQELQERFPHCGLKCSALIQAVESLDESIEIVVFADADVVASDGWLESLARPLSDPKVGLVTGAQWFEPPDSASGSWLRSIWNSGATVPTILLSHPWAGSCAMRRRDLMRSGLVERWKNSIVDDGPMAGAITDLGLELRFVSEAWMVNREHCSLAFACRYLKRMLTWSRLYESTYLLTVLHALLCAGLYAGLAVWTAISIAMNQLDLALVSGVAVGVFWICCLVGYWGVRQTVRQLARSRGEVLPGMTVAAWGCLIFGLPLTYIVNAWAAVSALWVRRIQWRGIEYDIVSGHDVRLRHYEPYRIKSPSTPHSL